MSEQEALAAQSVCVVPCSGIGKSYGSVSA